MGYKSPKGYRQNRYFTRIDIRDMHYCESHNFVYNPEEQEKLLYDGKPCFYTDNRYIARNNSCGECFLHWDRQNPISLKSAFRKIESCRNIPVGTLVEIDTDYYYPSRRIDTRFIYKIRTQNGFEPDYQINYPEFFADISEDQKTKSLVDILRTNGFLVKIWPNTHFIIGGKPEGQIFIAHGHGIVVGGSTYDNTFRGYSNGRNNILWDRYGKFDKWSRCNEVDKSLSVESIVNEMLKSRV